MRRRQKLTEAREHGAQEVAQAPAWEPVLMRPAIEPHVLHIEPAYLEALVTPDPNACPKCGRILKARGKHLHTRRCQGPK